MPTIDTLPPTPSPDFGQGFNYNVWTANTVVTFCDVPWNSDYRDIVEFENQAALDSYLNGVAGPSIGIEGLTLARAGDPIKVNIPFNAAYIYNYIRVQNNTSPITAHYTDPSGHSRTIIDTPKTLYYFIMSIQYLSPNTTRITVQLDVWQTFGFDITFGNCYIEQGHIGVANENQFENNGRDYLTVPEGLDIGAEYCINETYRESLTSDYVTGGTDLVNDTWIVMGIAADVTSNPGTTEAPNLDLWTGGSISENMPNGFDVLVFVNQGAYRAFIGNYAQTPWITQTIQFITMIPAMEIGAGNLTDVVIWDTATGAPWSGDPLCYHYQNFISGSQGVTEARDITLASDFRADAKSFIPDRYSFLKKFLVFPYCFVEVTTYNASPLVLKPELIPSTPITLKVYQHMSPPNPRWAIVPLHYNATGTGGTVDDGEFLDFATFITNFPQFTVINDSYLEYLAQNFGSIAYQYENASWAQQKALHGASTSYGNIGFDVQNQLNQAQFQQQANNARLRVANAGAIANIAGDIGQGALTLGTTGSGKGPGGFAGSAGDYVNEGAGFAIRGAQNNIANNLLNQGTGSNVGAETSIGLNNLSYAQFAAKGDYQNAILGIQAQINNARMIQPTSVGQVGGEAFFAAINGMWKIYGKLKQINPGMMVVIGEYWLRYGYAINRFGVMPDSLQVMSKFTYWKLKETYITSSRCPEIFKQTIRGIFEKGVTVWANPNDIGNIDIGTNTPLSGVSY